MGSAGSDTSQEAEIICGAHKHPFDVIRVTAALRTEGSDVTRLQKTFDNRFNLDICMATRNHFMNYLQGLNGIEQHKDHVAIAAVMSGCRRN